MHRIWISNYNTSTHQKKAAAALVLVLVRTAAHERTTYDSSLISQSQQAHPLPQAHMLAHAASRIRQQKPRGHRHKTHSTNANGRDTRERKQTDATPTHAVSPQPSILICICTLYIATQRGPSTSTSIRSTPYRTHHATRRQRSHECGWFHFNFAQVPKPPPAREHTPLARRRARTRRSKATPPQLHAVIWISWRERTRAREGSSLLLPYQSGGDRRTGVTPRQVKRRPHSCYHPPV